MPQYVFISYSSLDKTAADTVCSILEQNGISCWMAPRDITPGLDFAEAIIDGIKSSKLFILVYSSNSSNSKQVIREVDRAVHTGLPVINLRLEDVPLSKQLEYYLSSVHWLDAMTPPLEEHIDKLSGVVKILLRKDDAKDDDLEKAIKNGMLKVGQDNRSTTAAGKNHWKKAAITIAVLGVILIAALLIGLPQWKQKISLETNAMDKSIAVLPFDNLSGDPDQEYFSDGMMDEILDRLFKIGDLKVISRTSSMRYKNSALSLKEIAGELGVSAILEGSVRRAGNLVRITVQLIDAGTDAHLWSETYDGDLSDLSRIFIIQSEVAQSVARELKAVISPQEIELIEKIPTKDLAAYDAYLKGKFNNNKLTKEDMDIAMQFFELAKERDPDFALAYSGIANVWICRQQMGIVKVSEASPLSEAAIMKALELDSTLSEVNSTLAGRRVWTDWDWEGGEEAFRKAIEINPNNALAYSAYSHLLNILGRPDEAMEHIEIALELDPLNPQIWAFYGVDLMFVRRFDEAVTAFRKALEISPQHIVAISNLDLALYYANRDPEEVIDALSNKYQAIAGPAFHDIMKKYYPEGGWSLLHKKIAELRVAMLDSVYSGPLTISNCYALAGDIDNAIYWMEKAYEEHDPNLPYLLSPRLDILRDDPRFQEIARKMNLPYK
ncbi:MAG: TIR domain-containing protein [Bacteroidales bacterium]